MLRAWFENLSKNVVFGLGLALVVGLGWIDYLSGPEVGFSIFYLLPITLVEGRSGPVYATVLAVLAAGAWITADIAAGQQYTYVWIPFWNTGTRLLMFMIVVRLLASLRAAIDAHKELAMRDSLTGVLNPRAFSAIAKETVERSRRDGFPFTVVYLDLDDFKAINDRLGHTGGDEALRVVADALTNSIRSTDIVGRLGGDEFGLIFPRTGSAAATVALDDIVERVRRGVARIPFEVTFSAGAGTFLVAPESIDDVIKISDELMYDAKRAGKNRYVHIVVGEDDPGSVPDSTPPRKAMAGG